MIEEDLNSDNDSQKIFNSPEKTSYCRQSVELAIKKKLLKNFEDLKEKTSKRIEAMENAAISSRKFVKPFMIKSSSKKLQDDVTRDSKDQIPSPRQIPPQQKSNRELLSMDIRDYQKIGKIEASGSLKSHKRVMTSASKLITHKRTNTLGNGTTTGSFHSGLR